MGTDETQIFMIFHPATFYTPHQGSQAGGRHTRQYFISHRATSSFFFLIQLLAVKVILDLLLECFELFMVMACGIIVFEVG